MMPDERDQLLTLFHAPTRWTQHVEAMDQRGEPVRYDSAGAVAWDLTGAICHLFGWRRGLALFEQLDRHAHGKRAAVGWPPRDTALDAFSRLQALNDGDETTFADVRQLIETMPVWRGGRTAGAEGAAVPGAPFEGNEQME